MFNIPPIPIQIPISYPLVLFSQLDMEADSYRFERDKDHDSGEARFNSFDLSENHKNSFRIMKAYLEKLIPDFDFHTIRLHKFSRYDTIARHVDLSYMDSYSLVVRIDHNTDDNRLKISDQLMQEGNGQGYLMYPLTPHEVLPGKEERVTLVGWAFKKEGNNE